MELLKLNSFFLFLGWGKPYIHPFRNLEMHPFNSALHYAMQCFEGSKAFKGTDGKIRLFRLHSNMLRLKNSCKSLSLPVKSQLLIELANNFISFLLIIIFIL